MKKVPSERTCKGCLALNWDKRGHKAFCKLGFGIRLLKAKYIWGFMTVRVPTPMHMCPKPETMEDYEIDYSIYVRG